MTAPRSRRIGEELERVRSRVFVGRQVELDLLGRALSEEGGAAIFFHGPGGIGKTELLRAIEREARRGGARPVRVSAREVPPSPEALVAALAMASGGSVETSVEALAAHLRAHRAVVLIDGFEQLQEIEWFVGRTLASSLGVPVILAGRLPPDPARWAVAPLERRLEALEREEALQLLERYGVPPERRSSLYEVTRGYPLALALAARMNADADTTAGLADIGLVRALLEHLIDRVPSPLHRQALHLSGLVLRVRPELLERLDSERAGEVYEWLRTLSFVEETPLGLSVHDVVREALATDVRWRAPTHFVALRRLLRDELLDAARRGRWRTEPHLLQETYHALRHFEAAQRLFEQSPDVAKMAVSPPSLPSPARPEELVLVERALERFEGGGALEVWRHWNRRGAETHIAHDASGAARGFATIVWLELASDEELALDPDILPLARLTEHHRREGRVFVVRFWGSFEHHHEPSDARAALFQWFTAQTASRDDVKAAFSFDADPERAARDVQTWKVHRRYPELDYVLDGTRYGCIGSVHDGGTTVSFMRSIEALTREGSNGSGTMSTKQLSAQVKRALKNIDRPDLLADSPLVRTSLVSPEVDGRARAEALARILRAECEALRGDDMLYRVIDRTFLRPAPKQYTAALELGMAYATFRRHLARAIDQIAESLRKRM